MLKVSLVHVIRHKVLVEGIPIRAVARELGVSRNTIRKYMKNSEPVFHAPIHRRSPVLEQVAGRVEELREEWKGRTTAKQRFTACRIHRQLREEGYQVGITTVRSYLAEKRRQAREVYIPLVYAPGEVAQVDFFEVNVEVGGIRVSAWKFLMHLMYSGAEFAWIYERANQIAFLDAHVRAFAYFGGIPKRVVYDNLSAAVKKRMGIDRMLTERFQALASHYLFEPCFARPGEGHDKGGVESRGKSIRLQHLTPIPRGETLQEISTALLARLEAERNHTKDRAGQTIAVRLVEELKACLPLPDRPFEARLALPVLVSSSATVSVEGAQYSVPCHWVHLSVMAYVGVADIHLVCRGEKFQVNKLPRGGRGIHYVHYLSELARKPNAVRQVAPQLLCELGEPYRELWSRIEKHYGAKDAARVLSRLLGVSAHPDAEHLVSRLLQPFNSARCEDEPSPSSTSVVVPPALAGYVVEAGCAADYDRLLAGAAHE